MPSTILVTGATGNTGQELIRVLRRRGLPFTAALRDPAQAKRRLGADVAAAALDFLRPETFRPAVEGIRSVFLLRPPAISKVEPTLNAFIDVARDAGVEQIVFVSVAGAESNRWVPHHGVEQRLKRDPAGWTILRPGFFAQNLQDAYLRDIREDGRIYVPAGRGRVAFIDVADMAEVAASALAEPEQHSAKAYTLTGGEAVGLAQVADILSESLGRPIRYVPASLPGYLWHLRRRRGLPWAQCLVQTVLHVGLRFGQAEAVDPTLGELLGRAPTTMAEYIGGRRQVWE